jgi:hypothetical protein
VTTQALQGRPPTYCEDCTHAQTYVVSHTGNKSELPAYRWLCMRRPRGDERNFVSRTLRVAEPYYRCGDVNDGNCQLYAAKREPAHV